MIPQHLRAKLEELCFDQLGKNSIVFIKGAESLYALLQETAPDDERDAEKYTEDRSVVDYYNASIDNRIYVAFLAGRSGTVPKAHVDRLVKEAVEKALEEEREYQENSGGYGI